ncbi:MAG TPA: DUF692 domain-containing protein [Aquimonas sp.]|jgi:uncharacterized protein (UPF0276 family)|nr:DUF692 domain-containing protein [Aquimonas sp.]HRF54567.1 DUF692 domain-containing protein [Aquimonas sp.]
MPMNIDIDRSLAGLGLRRALLDALCEQRPSGIGFLELAPENWIGVGGKRAKALHQLREQYPIYCHGLSLSIGGPEPLDTNYLKRLRSFLDHMDTSLYSDHLSFCSDDGQLYDLLPLPFADEAIRHVATRVQQVQDALQRRIALENVSYYAAPYQAMSEIDFINAVLQEADCELLLDVNNIYVNSINHRYDADAFLRALPAERVRGIHVAGHYHEAPDLIIDTHGADVIDPVWQLLDQAYAHCGLQPTVLERDFNLPSLDVLLQEVERIAQCQRNHLAVSCHAPRT